MPHSNGPASSADAGSRPLAPVLGAGAAGSPGTAVLPGRDLCLRPVPPVRSRPLPDAVGIYAVVVPQIAPQYDDAWAAAATAHSPATPGPVPVLAVRIQSHANGPDGEAQPATIRPAPAQPATIRPDLAQGLATRAASGQPPAEGAWPSKFAQVLAETLAGSRPPDQIVPWTTEQARKRIGQLGPLLATGHRPRVRRVLVTSPASNVLEMTVIVGLGPRVRALAVRLERIDQPAPGISGRPGVSGRPSRSPRSPAPLALAKTAHPTAASAATAIDGRPQETARWRCTAVEAA